MKKLLQKFIDKEINSMLQLHNGSCELVDVEDNIASIRLKGGCVGCPSSNITLYTYIVPQIKAKFPKITDVILA